jgi:hypothetical protein
MGVLGVKSRLPGPPERPILEASGWGARASSSESPGRVANPGSLPALLCGEKRLTAHQSTVSSEPPKRSGRPA